MATPAVLRSRDCLRRNPQFNHTPKPHNHSRCYPEFNSRRNEIKNKIPATITAPKFPNFPNKMVMGEVKILKRGDPLPQEKIIEPKPLPQDKKIEPKPKKIEPKPKKIESKPHHPVKKTTMAAVQKTGESDLVLGSATRLGPEPEMVQKQIKVADFNLAPPHPSSHFYAGSGPLVAAPHPSCLPLPIKLTMKSRKIIPFDQ